MNKAASATDAYPACKRQWLIVLQLQQGRKGDIEVAVDASIQSNQKRFMQDAYLA